MQGEALARVRDFTLTEFARHGQVHLSLRGREWKLILGPHGEELYQLREDPWELRNLAGSSQARGQREARQGAFLAEYRQVFARFGNLARHYPRQDWNVLTM